MEYNPKQLNRDERIAKAYEMRLEYKTYEEISYVLGVAKSTAFEWVKIAKERYEDFQEKNLNYLRNMRVAQLEVLLQSRYKDLKICLDIENPETGRLERDGIRGRSYIVGDMLRLQQEIHKLEGLYDTEAVNSFMVSTETSSNVEVEQMSDDELLEFFNDYQRSK